MGLEPTASGLEVRRAIHCATETDNGRFSKAILFGTYRYAQSYISLDYDDISTQLPDTKCSITAGYCSRLHEGSTSIARDWARLVHAHVTFITPLSAVTMFMHTARVVNYLLTYNEAQVLAFNSHVA